MGNLESNVKHYSASFTSVVSYGILLALIFSFIFMIAKIFGVEQVVWLRFINYFLFFPVAYVAIKRVYKINEKLNYFNGLKIGFLVCFWGQFIYTILFFIYLHFDKELVAFIRTQLSNGLLLNPEVSISFILFSEGLAWSAITAFSLMQIFKWKRGLWAVHS
jgi:hypothetical protein